MSAESPRHFYLDFVNNYGTAARMASDYGFSVEFTLSAINEGRRLHEEFVASLR